MNEDTIKKTLAVISVTGAIAGGSIVVDNAIVTDAEIKESIELAIVNGEIPLVDISKISIERVIQGYLEVAQENGVELSSTDVSANLYDEIREEKISNGEVVKEKTDDVFKIQ